MSCSTTIEPVLFARVNESVLERFNGCNFGKKVMEKRWFFGRKVHLLTKPFSQEKRQRQLNGKRVGAKRAFNALKKLGLEHGVLVKTAWSLGSHILAVLTCLLGIQYLNLRKCRKPLAYAAFLL